MIRAFLWVTDPKKLRLYKQRQLRVLDVEMGSFSLLVFGTSGRMGKEYKLFLSKLADKLSRKNDSYASAVSWLRTRISLEILRSVYTCVDDLSVNAKTADIF